MTTETTAANPGHPVLAGIRSVATNIFDIFAGYNQAARCAQEAQRLSALSDEALARRGLSRDRIISHAFRSYLGA